MAGEKSYARLGLFVVVGLIVVVATALFFVQRVRSRALIEIVTYTTENVSGLDISSPVRFRGVPVGRVADIRLGPRGLFIEISFELFVDRLNVIGANVKRVREFADLEVFPQLRAQVVGNVVTGEAYLLLDMPENPRPPITLPFDPSGAYVPSMPSMAAVVQDRLPALMDRAEVTLQTLAAIVDRIPDSLDRSNRFFTNVERIFRESEFPALSADSRKFSTTTSAQIERMTTELNGVIGAKGTLATFADEARAAIEAADFPGTNKSARESLDRTSLAADDLRRSLPAIRESLEQLRELARQLQEQPESVVYGPRPAAGKRK
jgi:paraquat-inducible protein B